MAASQRAWRAACPNCGAPVEFASAASASAVCSFCRSTLLRDGETLRRIGVVAELFDDHSPLQLGATGQLQGLAFTLVGRLQYGYEGGTWNEWHALFDNGRSGWLSEDNGAYVFGFDTPIADAPPAAALRAGARATVGGQAWDVASVVSAKLISAQGELPQPPRLSGEFTVVDLRNVLGEVGTLDYAGTTPAWSIGRSIALSELALGGLRDDVAEKTLSSRSIECPSCGNALAPTLATTKSLSCPQCRAVVDISQGAGADLAYYAQNNSGEGGLEPQIPLGRTGMLGLGGAPQPWQVVGYMERCTIPGGGDDDESYFWREYLLYNRTQGFAFLVDAEDGWSFVKPLTGAPQVNGDRATYQGATYLKRESYGAKVTWVQGEFYWRVRRDERALVADYTGTGLASKKRLSREQAGNEVTWSGGETLAASDVGSAFGLQGLKSASPIRLDAMPGSSAFGGPLKIIVVFVVIVLLVLLLSRCDDDDCRDARATFGESSNEYQQCLRNRNSGGVRTGGGSYGGWSSGGGGHK